MKTIKFLSAVLALASALVMTSCLGKGDENGYTVTTNYTDLFNAVVTNDGAVTIYPKQSIKVDWSYNEPTTANVQIAGLQLPGMTSFPILQFNNAPWRINGKGWMEISGTDIHPGSQSGFANNLVFNRFSLQTINRLYDGKQFPPCINITYTVNDTYRVFALPVEIIEVGKTEVRDLASGTSFVQSESNRSIYYIELDPAAKKAIVAIQGAQFAANMPGLNMKFADIPFDVNAAGVITLSCDELTPALMTTNDIFHAGTPAPNYPITNFKATYIADYGVTISFNCTPKNKQGIEMGKYGVTFTCLYPTSAAQATIQ